ncbi:fluoride efflux transporter CrcB [Halobacillus sp. Marseille-Q1614]|uniref:fluoride efflux transporter CrcB n=1 Tax=Halobacillus sp. Marseille-Q1614 TaxID=2709134 RepID=UPI00156DF6BB|nr:fluoride efflux transporter CrcB [Halobacillus sp. Marseille-Q1614]
MIYVWVGIAGALGASLRYLLSIWMYGADQYFPFSTLSVNLIGSFFLAWFTYTAFTKLQMSSQLKTAAATGFLGSFTTFSTFSLETVILLENSEFLLALIYVTLSMTGGYSLSYLGCLLGKRRWAA